MYRLTTLVDQRKKYHFDVIQSKPNKKNDQTQEGKSEMIFSQIDQARGAGGDEKSKTAHIKSKTQVR